MSHRFIQLRVQSGACFSAVSLELSKFDYCSHITETENLCQRRIKNLFSETRRYLWTLFASKAFLPKLKFHYWSLLLMSGR